MVVEKQKRVIFAPQPLLVSSSQMPTNRLISVEVDENEDVQWVWTVLPDGTKFVSGYTIVAIQS